MINWDFNANDVEESFPIIPTGDHRLRIASAEEKQSKKGLNMIELSLDVSGYPGRLYYYLVFMPDNTKMTNTNLSRLWDSFGIQSGNLNIASWVGKVGAGRVKHEPYNGDMTAKVSYFLDRQKQEKLPAWVEKSAGGVPAASAGFNALPSNTPVPFDMGDLPL